MLLDIDDRLDGILGHYVRCFVNGEEVTHTCQAASEEEGWALIIPRDWWGNIRAITRRSGKRELAKAVLFGDVRFSAPHYVRRIAEHRYSNDR